MASGSTTIAVVFPDWLQITFNGVKTIDRIDVFTVQDDYAAPATPTPTMTFSLYGLQDFDVQYWNSSAWVTVPGGAITGNNLVWRTVSFPAVSTDRIRILVKSALANYSRIAEVEAWTSRWRAFEHTAHRQPERTRQQRQLHRTGEHHADRHRCGQ